MEINMFTINFLQIFCICNFLQDNAEKQLYLIKRMKTKVIPKASTFFRRKLVSGRAAWDETITSKKSWALCANSLCRCFNLQNKFGKSLPYKLVKMGLSVEVQQLGLWASTPERMGPILGQETKILEAGWLGKKKKKKNWGYLVLGGKM